MSDRNLDYENRRDLDLESWLLSLGAPSDEELSAWAAQEAQRDESEDRENEHFDSRW